MYTFSCDLDKHEFIRPTTPLRELQLNDDVIHLWAGSCGDLFKNGCPSMLGQFIDKGRFRFLQQIFPILTAALRQHQQVGHSLHIHMGFVFPYGHDLNTNKYLFCFLLKTLITFFLFQQPVGSEHLKNWSSVDLNLCCEFCFL